MVEALKEHLLRKPFAPFRMTLRNGEQLDVTRQFQVAVGLTKFSYAPPASRTTVQLDLKDIVSLERLEVKKN
jgi:hypothetical protein